MNVRERLPQSKREKKPSQAAGVFATRIIRWHKHHGRHDLPWQGTRDPYRIWVSEIMLQQTQVSAVIPYFKRFMTSFPTVASLAGASSDAVMQHWSGLGYYSRARNLHAAAKMIQSEHSGCFPQSAEEIAILPGIGRSTAAAIAAFAFGERTAILDGNVKRVLCRAFGIDGFPGESAVEKKLWSLAESLLPETDIEIHTQALMDLGATVCTRGKPACGICPLAGDCVANLEGRTDTLPTPRPRKTVPARSTTMLVLVHDGRVLLELRPQSGIWGGLWSLPEAEAGADLEAMCSLRFGIRLDSAQPLPSVRHGFTHFTLDIQPMLCRADGIATALAEPGYRWFAPEEIAGAGLPAPVKRLLLALRFDESTPRGRSPIS
jgi:A/G-specific adenine glycosylase